MLIQFTVPGAPRGKGRPQAKRRFRKGGAQYVALITPEKTVQYENLVSLMAAQAMQGRAPIDGPVRLVLQVRVPVPESWSQKKRARALTGDLFPTGKPDLDNIEKAIADGCNRIVFRDDSQVCFVTKWKRYSETPGVQVTVRAVQSRNDLFGAQSDAA